MTGRPATAQAGSPGPLPAGLYVVATPIGNLGDITDRARSTLASVDLVAAEDTRRTRALLSALSVVAPDLMRLDDHTEGSAAARLVEQIAAGRSVAVVTDAGTPGVSDPGGRLVAAVVDAGLDVIPVPGASAALAALTASGLPTARFAVDGFLPRKGEARRRRLAALATEERTTVLFESPHRLVATLGDLVGACGPERPAAVARELTKLHEEIVRGPLSEIIARMDGKVRGEVAIVVGPAPPAEPASDAEIRAALEAEVAAGGSTRDRVDRVAAVLDAPRRRVYDLALQMGAGRGEPPAT